MRIFLFFIFFTFIFYAKSENRETLLREIDREVAKNTDYVEQKQKQIEQLKENLTAANFPAEQYLIYKRLYNSYKKFDGDSAIVYAKICLQYGMQNHRDDWIKESELNILKIYSLRSFQPFASTSLNNYGREYEVLAELQIEYITTLFDNQIRLQSAAKDSPFEEKTKIVANDLWENYHKYLPLDYWCYSYYQFSLSKTKLDLEDKITEELNRTQPYSEERALLEYNLAKQLKQKGDNNGYFEHLVLSAICDIRSANRETQSLLQIIKILQDDNSQVKRVFNYALLCEENAAIYKDLGRSVNLISSQSIIQKTYKKEIENQHAIMLITLLILGILLTIIMVLFILLRRKQYKQEGCLNIITEKNNKLKEQYIKEKEIIEEVTNTNLQLVNKVQKRDTYFMNVFYLYSESIRNTKNMRKKMEHLLKVGKVNDALKMASTTKFDDDLLNLYTQFDRAFLAIHPDFIYKINNLLKDEYHFIIKKDDTLNPELRIYALIYLGITNSSKIAEFLHYSPQTVYNYRLKIRHQSRIPEKEFEEAVKKLYL